MSKLTAVARLKVVAAESQEQALAKVLDKLDKLGFDTNAGGKPEHMLEDGRIEADKPGKTAGTSVHIEVSASSSSGKADITFYVLGLGRAGVTFDDGDFGLPDNPAGMTVTADKTIKIFTDLKELAKDATKAAKVMEDGILSVWGPIKKRK